MHRLQGGRALLYFPLPLQREVDWPITMLAVIRGQRACVIGVKLNTAAKPHRFASKAAELLGR